MPSEPASTTSATVQRPVSDRCLKDGMRRPFAITPIRFLIGVMFNGRCVRSKRWPNQTLSRYPGRIEMQPGQ